MQRFLDGTLSDEAVRASGDIRRLILDQQGGCCGICGIPPQWNNKDLVFILDHLDGDSTHNHPSNVRLICPNCNSQTPTFAGRNKGKGRASRREKYVGR
jgi:hypothetical protein